MQALMARDMPKVSLDFKGLTAENYSLNDLGQIQCRALIMTGQYSPELSHLLSSEIRANLPKVEHKTFPTGHMGPVSHSELIHSEIAEFIHQI